MMKGTTTKNVFLLLFLFVCLGTHAQEASQEAIGVAREFIRSSEGFAKMRKAGRRIELTATPIEGTPFHAVNLAEGRGFVLVDTHGNSSHPHGDRAGHTIPNARCGTRMC